ncbi:hypothetical protein T07_13259, partial [Trichinella nelsoni]
MLDSECMHISVFKNIAKRIVLSILQDLIMLGIERNHSISNLRKPAFTATCAVSVFYANWA